MSISKIFIPDFVCVLKNKKYETYLTEFSFCCQGHAPGWDCGVLGESKTLEWGFVMAPHQLRALVLITKTISKIFFTQTLCAFSQMEDI